MSQTNPPGLHPALRHKGRWILVGVVFLLAGSAFSSVLRARTREDPTIPEGARAALERARSSPAARWAPESLARAEEAYRQGMAELTRAQGRFFLFRDLRPAADSLARAELLAGEALEEGRRAMEGRREGATSILQEASVALQELDEIEARVSLASGPRGTLAAARLGLVEATSALELGEYERAERRGREVLAQAERVVAALGEALLRFADEERVRTWRQWIDETVAWSRAQSAVALVVLKEQNRLVVYRNGREMKSFAADMGSNNLAEKYRQGDRATPEGRYKIKQIKDRGHSQYYKALLLDYPTREDMRRFEAAKASGAVPANARPGGLIEIHGEGGMGTDWTNGCVAVANPDMDEIFRMVKVGTPVTIVGGDGSEGAFSSLGRRLRRDR